MEYLQVGDEKGCSNLRSGVCLHIKGLATTVEIKPGTAYGPHEVNVRFAGKQARDSEKPLGNFVGVLDFPGPADLSYISSLFWGRARFLFLAMTWSKAGLHGLLLKPVGSSAHRRSIQGASAYQRIGYVRPTAQKSRHIIRRGSYIFDDEVLE